jgi:ubiquinone biosynthesis protein
VAEPGAFTADGPWVVDPPSMPWRDGIAGRRAAAQAQVPVLVRRRRLPPARAAGVLVRLLVATLPWAVRHRRDKDTTEARAELAARIRPVFERLGTTYIKLGQVLASAEGMLPIELVQEFRRCRDHVPAETFRHVREVVEAELGRPIDDVFAAFEREPLAAASIAQVHAATLRSGEEVVVKVQRPHVGRTVAADLAVLSWLAPLLERFAPAVRLANLPAYVELFAETIVEELDFRLEAENLLDVARVLGTVEATPVVVPRPHPELVTERVLVMQRMRGFTVDDDAGLVEAGIDPAPVLRALMVMLVEGALVHGVFHGDLHGGNMFVLADGRACIFDLGITGRLDDERRTALVGFLMAAITQDTDAQLRHFQTMGGLPADADLVAVAAELELDELNAANQAGMSPEQLAEVMQVTLKRLVANGARVPKPLFLYVKNNIYLNGAIAALAPDIDVIAEIGAVLEIFASAHADRFRDELGIHLDDGSFTAAAVTELARQQLGTDVAGLTSAQLNEIQNERLRAARAAKSDRS